MPLITQGAAAHLPAGFLVGHATNAAAATGCTVVLAPEGACGSVAVRGGAPATRETDLLAPENSVQEVHAVVLSGGSAFGLDACSGVARLLELQGHGVSFAGAVVPIVVGASLFDLDVGSATVRPDATMGYAAAQQAQAAVGATGNVGAGTGASVGRFLGPASAMKGGLGAAAVQEGELLVTALVAVNALGTVYDRARGRYVAGAYLELDGTRRIVEPLDLLPQVLAAMAQASEASDAASALSAEGRTNTTIGVILTNARLTKAEALRVASMAHDGLARAIYPTHTSFDGDALFTLASGAVVTSPDLVGCLAAVAVEHAILDAVTAAESAYGLPAARDIDAGA